MRRYLKPLGHTVLALAVSTSLAACGGGGGDSAGDGNERIFQTASDAGVAVTGGSSLPSFSSRRQSVRLGDDDDNSAGRILLRFPFTLLPFDATVVGAFLHLRTTARINLTSNELGRMRFVRIDGGGSLGSNDYDSAELAHDSDADFLVSPENFDLRIGILDLYQSAVAASDSFVDIRVQYENETDNDGQRDALQFAMTEHPTLDAPRIEIVYRRP